jgi:hypothetical protein
MRDYLVSTNCWDPTTNTRTPACAAVPADCAAFNMMQDIFYRLTPRGYLAGPEGSEGGEGGEGAGGTGSTGGAGGTAGAIETRLMSARALVPLIRYPSDKKAYQAWLTWATKLHTDTLGGIRATDRAKNAAARVVAYRVAPTKTVELKYDIFSGQLGSDALYAVASLCLIFAIMWWHTGSLLITGLSFVQILSSVGVAYSVYTLVLRLGHFPWLNAVGIFIILGIGSDDVFVYMDAWKQVGGTAERGAVGGG